VRSCRPEEVFLVHAFPEQGSDPGSSLRGPASLGAAEKKLIFRTVSCVWILKILLIQPYHHREYVQSLGAVKPQYQYNQLCSKFTKG
jgi:hypothetical protein